MLLRKACTWIFNFQVINIAETTSPRKLKDISLSSIADNYQDETANKISKKICPQMFNNEIGLENSGFNSIFFNSKLINRELDLSGMDLKTIPMVFSRRLKSLEILNLSKNQNLKLQEEWFEEISEKLKEIRLNDCNLQQNDLEVLSKLKKLEILEISNNKKLDFESPHFITILKRLKYLDISECSLNFNIFEKILKHAENLESLNFNGNKLHKPFENIQIPHLSRKKLKVLHLSDCGIETKDLKSIFEFKNLEMINLSHNNFSNIDPAVIYDLFESQECDTDNIDNRPKKRRFSKISGSFENVTELSADSLSLKGSNQFGYSSKNLKKLKVISLINCKIKSKEFISKIFNLENLQILQLSWNNLNFDFSEIVLGKAKDSLKILKVDGCSIFNHENLYHLTNLNKLEALDISENPLSEIPFGFELGNSKESLKGLIIGNCELNYNGLKAITDCKLLETLNASFNKFKNIPWGFSFGQSKNSLKILNLKNSKLNWHGLKAITECSKLEHLDASKNNFGGMPNNFTFDALKNSIKIIKIFECNLKKHGLIALMECSKLEILDASFNEFENIPEGFIFSHSINSLKDVNLTKTNLNLYGLKAITNCPNIKRLIVSKNIFGNMTKEFNFGISKDSLETIDINNCNLNYFGLKALTNCTNLKQLDASFNDFKDIPDQFRFDWIKYSLKSLNIASSKLNKNGLMAISECTKLENLNVSGNGFENLKIDQKNIHNYLKAYLDSLNNLD